MAISDYTSGKARITITTTTMIKPVIVVVVEEYIYFRYMVYSPEVVVQQVWDYHNYFVSDV